MLIFLIDFKKIYWVFIYVLSKDILSILMVSYNKIDQLKPLLVFQYILINLKQFAVYF